MSKLTFLSDETVEEFIYRAGSMKEAGEIKDTWEDISNVITKHAGGVKIKSANACAKLYRKVKNAIAAKETAEEDYVVENPIPQEQIVSIVTEDEIAKDERAAISRIRKDIARSKNIIDSLRDVLKTYEPVPIPMPKSEYKHTAVYAMLSDIHYGIAFDNDIGVYNSDIAKTRLMKYAYEICKAGKHHNTNTCYISLMGDLISGLIHTTIKIENRENTAQQVSGVAYAISEFLKEIAKSFTEVFINNVPGNHGRITVSVEDSTVEDSFDCIVFDMIQAICQNQKNLNFITKHNIAPNVGDFVIFDKLYCSIHGDTTMKLEDVSEKISRQAKKPVDYLLAGHMHIGSCNLGQRPFIRNGCLCGSGDDYCVRRNLYGPASQTFMVCDQHGVEAIYPVVFEREIGKGAFTL